MTDDVDEAVRIIVEADAALASGSAQNGNG
jgi:hypothetical protein